jgi:hypothetical protein
MDMVFGKIPLRCRHQKFQIAHFSFAEPRISRKAGRNNIPAVAVSDFVLEISLAFCDCVKL